MEGAERIGGIIINPYELIGVRVRLKTKRELAMLINDAPIIVEEMYGFLGKIVTVSRIDRTYIGKRAFRIKEDNGDWLWGFHIIKYIILDSNNSNFYSHLNRFKSVKKYLLERRRENE